MKTVDFDIDHIDDFIKSLDELQNTLKAKTAIMEEGLRDLAEGIYQNHLLDVKVFTGELMTDAYVHSSTSGNTVDVEIGNTSPHAYFVENGTGKFIGRKDVWYVHESQLPKGAAEAYNFTLIDQDTGIYAVHGQGPKFFFANTIEDLRTYVPEAIKEIFKDI